MGFDYSDIVNGLIIFMLIGSCCTLLFVILNLLIYVNQLRGELRKLKDTQMASHQGISKRMSQTA